MWTRTRCGVAPTRRVTVEPEPRSDPRPRTTLSIADRPSPTLQRCRCCRCLCHRLMEGARPSSSRQNASGLSAFTAACAPDAEPFAWAAIRAPTRRSRRTPQGRPVPPVPERGRLDSPTDTQRCCLLTSTRYARRTVFGPGIPHRRTATQFWGCRHRHTRCGATRPVNRWATSRVGEPPVWCLGAVAGVGGERIGAEPGYPPPSPPPSSPYRPIRSCFRSTLCARRSP